MINESIYANINQLPESYQEELLDFSEFLLFKARQKNSLNRNKKEAPGNWKRDYSMIEDSDKNLDLIPLKKASKKIKEIKKISAVELLQMNESQRMGILKQQASESLKYYSENDDSTLPDLCEDLMEYK